MQPLLTLNQEGKVDIDGLLSKRKQFYNSTKTLKLPDVYMRMNN
jgi:hypothetical protein